MPRPYFSIIIPTYNRPQQLATCLQSLLKLNYPADRYEVIVVNDGGDEEPIADLCAQDRRLSTITQTNAGPGIARNQGAALAQGEFLAFIDDDCQATSDWLTYLADELLHSPNSLVGGQTSNALTENLYAAASQMLIEYLYDYFYQGDGRLVFLASNNMAGSAQIFADVGGFDTTFSLRTAEDRDLCDRWQLAGHHLRYVPDAKISHAHDLSARSFWWQHFHYGRGAYYFHQLRRQRRQEPVRIEPFSFYKELVLYPWQKGTTRKFLLSSLLLLTQIATASGYFNERLLNP